MIAASVPLSDSALVLQLLIFQVRVAVNARASSAARARVHRALQALVVAEVRVVDQTVLFIAAQVLRVCILLVIVVLVAE